MQNTNIVTAQVLMMDDEIIKIEVLELWNLVMQMGTKVISHWRNYGYDEMAVVPQPNIHALLVPVREMEEKMDQILASEDLQYDESRMIINAKQQILWIELLAAALTNNRRQDFDEVVLKLRTQAHI